MALPVKLNLKLYQGSTFIQVLRWESAELAYAEISNISKAAPAVITTSAAHTIPVGWRFKVSNVVGMKEINTDNYLSASDVDSTTITLNELNSVGYSTYTSGGIIQYNVPESLAGCTASMQIRQKLTSTETIDELTSAAGDIVLDNVNKNIVITIPAAVTAAYTFSSAVYSLEITNGVVVTPLIYGNITLNREITR